MTSPLADLLNDLNAVFEQTSTQWYVFGAQAAIIHGASRLTADVDVTVLFGDHPIESLVDALTKKGFDIRIDNIADFVDRTKILPVAHTKSGISCRYHFRWPRPRRAICTPRASI